MSIEDVADMLRADLGLAPGQRITAIVLAAALGFGLTKRSGQRSELRFDAAEICFDDLEPPHLQELAIARAACAGWLKRAGLLRLYSPHDLAVAMCNVSMDGGGTRAVVSVRRIRRVSHFA
jgi:hypothetical protein